jgi:hypothetical protein
MPRTKKDAVPAYRKKKVGRDCYAYVRLDGDVFMLGDYGSVDSRVE